jgi:phosphoribosylanthranilate isomerase
VICNSLKVKRFFRDPPEDVCVKICGVRDEAEAEAAIGSGADALGFNLYPGSKRFLDLRCEKNWICRLRTDIARIAVLVNPPIKDVLALLEDDTFDAIQFHGDESPGFFELIPANTKPLIKAFRMRNRATLKDAGNYPVFAFLLDSYRDGFFGGTGERFDWGIANQITLNKPVVLAGGLTADNVGEAVRLFRPHAVDVASGVENSEGRKEEDKIRKFVQAAKSAGRGPNTRLD